MVPSIFYGHNKQTAERKMCFCFPPVPGGRKGCCQEHQHHEEVGSCRVGTALLPAGSQGGGLCCTCQSSRAGRCLPPLTQARSVPTPVPSTPHLAAALCSTCFTEGGLYKMGRMGWGRKPSCLQHIENKTLPFYLKKLSASVLLDSHFSTKSINSHTGLLYILLAFQPG